ncbi:MAG: hypothetical protein H6779_03800 [Candidatus Nomurabacteria bacterium]|nr:MAG: hypothetical protein H6779_03800 [Candidatus Nomurabacteria bacterium]
MSRLKSNDAETAKRAPRRQVSKKTTPKIKKKAVPAPAPAIPIPRVVEVDGVDSTFERKAPTTLGVSTGSKSRVSKRGVIIVAVLIVVLGATLWIGFSDKGQIDVSEKIAERNAKIASGDTSSIEESPRGGSQVIPVQNTTPSVPNGGLRGRGVGTAKVSQPPVEDSIESASSTATSTATSTDVSTNEEGNSTSTESGATAGETEVVNETGADQVTTE